MKVFIILAALLVIGYAVGAGFAIGQENEAMQRCSQDGGVIVEGGTFFGTGVCIKESAVIW